MTDKNHLKLPSGQVIKWKEMEYPTVYANLMAFGMTPFDISLVFGEVGDTTPEEVTGIPRVKIILTPEQAANLVKILTVGLHAYVEGNGQLRLAGALDVDGFIAQIEAAKIGPKK